MRTASTGGGERVEGVSLPTDLRPSAWVRLEAALLDADELASTALVHTPAFSAALGGAVWLTVLVVAAEADLRYYVRECLRECLRERPGLRLAEASTIAAAVALAASQPPACHVVDEPERDVLGALASHRAVLLVDVPRNAPASASGLRLLARPFTAKELVAEVDRLAG